MEDRFKFRAWFIDYKEMEYDVQDAYDDRNHIGSCFGEYFTDSHPVVLMQCTGLKDKNGKLVFEGDILTKDNDDIDWLNGDAERILVKWSEKEARFYPFFYSVFGGEGYDGDENCQHLYKLIRTYPKDKELYYQGFVIKGNIHENPELLSDKND